GEAGRAAVRALDREGKDAVVPPVPVARELTDGHGLDPGHPQAGQLLEVTGGGVEGALLGEGPHMELVDDVALQRVVGPRLVRPPEGLRGEELRGAVDPFGL